MARTRFTWAVAMMLAVGGAPIGGGALVGCGGGPDSVDATTATVRTVRGEVRVADALAGPLARAAAGDGITTGDAARAQVELDSGAGLLLDASSRVVPGAEDDLEIVAGRVYVEVPSGAALRLTVGALELHAGDAALSVTTGQPGRILVVRGEVGYRTGDVRGTVRAGEELTLQSEGPPRVAPAVLWTDWTGGLARPGPTNASLGRGMGVLEARVPDELGVARWALTVRSLDVRVAIEGDLAITEVEQEFFNPASETVEGLYRASVPEGAVLQRFAVDREGTLVDGYVREQQQARAAYQAQVYRGSTDDPALLEWDAPGRYRARIYPIAPGEVRRIVIRYAEWLAPARPGGPRLYRYPIGSGEGAPHVQEMSFVADLAHAGAARVRAGMGARVEGQAVVLRRSDFRPLGDLWLELLDGEAEDAEAQGQRAYRAVHEAPERAPDARAIVHEADERDYWYLPLRLPPALTEAASRGGLDLVVVADVSAGTDRAHLELGRSVVESIAAHLGPQDRLSVVGADLALRPLGEGPEASALGPVEPARVEAMLDALGRMPAGGATDLGRAVADAAALLDPARPGAVVYVGDGAPTVGELAGEGLMTHLGRLPHPVRLYAVGVGPEARLELLDTLTRGGGMALRVESRADAAGAVLRMLAHAARPLLSRVTVELGSGIDNAFPRRPVDVVEGEVLAIVGRVRGAPPSAVTVRGEVAGRPFEVRVPVATETRAERVDLRLRWAAERLAQLLLDGAGREEVAELGTRCGLITPFTSYYVPSARELRAMGRLARVLERPGLDGAEVVLARQRANSPSSRWLAAALGPLTLTGCSRSERAAPALESSSASEEARAVDQTAVPGPAGGDDVGGTAWRGPMPEESDEGGQGAPSPATAAPMAAAPVAPAPPPPSEPAGLAQQARELRGGAAFVDGEAGAMEGLAEATTGAPRPDGEIGLGGLGVMGHGSGGGGTGSGYGSGARAPARSRRATNGIERTEDLPADGRADRRADPASVAGPAGVTSRVTVTTQITTVVSTATTPSHARLRCSDASARPLEDRRALWRERLAATSWTGAMVDVYREAIRACEVPDWRARRALLQLMRAQAGSIARTIELVRMLGDASGRSYLRAEIFRSVRSPEDLRLVRAAFGLGAAFDATLVEQVLAQAATPEARLRALRRLVSQTPESFDLRLRLLEELEVQSRTAEMLRLAEALRADPLADPGVRTALGEMYLRLGRQDEARRAFSEIVEFSPLDELARRRLGDLYRAHGWFEDAYRQYETLAQIRPDDASVLLLLAQAAAGAGRTDEALRLEQRAMETAAPGSREGLARTAQLWSSVRFAKLRSAARASDDADALAGLLARMRRSGVLRDAGDLRVTLTWAHPDAQLALWAGHPGLAPSRPSDLAPELGLEAFDVAEQEDGTYRIEVRRDARDRLGELDAELTVVWGEGRPDERVEVVPLHFDPTVRVQSWTLRGTELRAVEGRGPPDVAGGSRILRLPVPVRRNR